MNKLPDIAVKELVLIGGGHSHVGLLKMFAMNPLPGLRLTMLSSDVHTPYSGMLPGFVAGDYAFDDIHLDLRPLSEFAHCRLYHSRVSHIDTRQQLVYADNRPPVKYDLLSINIGSTPDDFNIPGVKQLTIAVKPVKAFISQLDRLIHQVLNDSSFSRVAVVGGGASGVEMILAVQQRIKLEMQKQGRQARPMHYQLISAAKNILPSHNHAVQQKFLQLFQQRGIELQLDCAIKEVTLQSDSEQRTIYCRNGTQLQADAIIWCTTASSSDWPAKSGLAVDKRGFIKVNDYLQSVSHPNIFAAGDIAAMINHPRPKSGVYAVRQGAPLFANTRRFISGQALKPYQPQKHFLSLLNCADKTAVASRGWLALQGKWLWQYKNWIDVRFMKAFSELPEMTATQDLAIHHNMVDDAALQRLQEIPMRCGGCGAKVGSTVLSRVIERLKTVYQGLAGGEGVIVGLQQSDDAAVIEVPPGKLLVQSLDYFKTFINDPYLLGRIAANHALGDLFAMGAQPHSALALATLPYSIDSIVEEELFQIMSGALEVMQAHNMTLLGGHTGEGADMAFGLNVNGFVSKDAMMTKSALQADELLILTKPLGTGTLLAANMRLKAKGRWIDGAIEQMLSSSKAAADIFNDFSVRACTDITGFGLLGHLLEMLNASEQSAHINLSALPILDGAHEMLKQGIFSSLQAENIHLRRAIKNMDEFAQHDNYPLLFDPQTAGGLLAGVAADQAATCLQQLHTAGYTQATIVGKVMTTDSTEHRITLTT